MLSHSTSSASLSLTDWSVDPTVLAGLGALCLLYAMAWRRGLLSSGDDVSPWFGSSRVRPWLFALGVLTGLLALQSPIDTGGDHYLLAIHMVQHLLLMMVAPPLVLLGIVGMRSPAVRVAPRVRALLTWITRPWQATLLFNVVLLVWHIPQLYNTTLTNDGLHIVEHLTFIAVGVVFWWPIVDPVRGPDTRLVGPFNKIAMLVLAGVPPTILGFIFALASSVFYSFYATAPRLWGISPSADQQLAGVIMFGVGNLVYFVAISVIFLRLFENPQHDEEAAAANQDV